MDLYGKEVSRPIEELSHLPGVGSRTAQRLAFHIINMPEDQAQALSESIINAKKKFITARLVAPLRKGTNVRSAHHPNVITRPSWWLKHQEILWQWKESADIRAFITFCMV